VTNSYDVIVVGCGAMGSAACMHLARRGAKVLGLEQFDIPHSLGSSHGYSRMIRMAYYEHPDYVPLLRRAYELWYELEALSRQKLLYRTGGIYMGPPAKSSSAQRKPPPSITSPTKSSTALPSPDDFLSSRCQKASKASGNLMRDFFSPRRSSPSTANRPCAQAQNFTAAKKSSIGATAGSKPTKPSTPAKK
jgi:hypothetical protein